MNYVYFFLLVFFGVGTVGVLMPMFRTKTGYWERWYALCWCATFASIAFFAFNQVRW